MNDAATPLIPVRMVNEYVYCPRLAYMMWFQEEFTLSADTVEGAIRHNCERTVFRSLRAPASLKREKGGGKMPPPSALWNVLGMPQ